MWRIRLINDRGFALIDDCDKDLVRDFRWRVHLNRGVPSYAKTHQNGKTISMHRFLMGPGPGLQVDHINRNGFDNRRCNMRLCTKDENGRNSRSHSDALSQYKGVTRTRSSIYPWEAVVRGKHLGRFRTEIEAARAYDDAARHEYGDYASLNFGQVVVVPDVDWDSVPVLETRGRRYRRRWTRGVLQAA